MYVETNIVACRGIFQVQFAAKSQFSMHSKSACIQAQQLHQAYVTIQLLKSAQQPVFSVPSSKPESSSNPSNLAHVHP